METRLRDLHGTRPDPCHTARVLLADDHTVVLEGLKRILGRAGYTVIGAVYDGRSLIESVARVHPDVVIVDVSMPNMTGIEAVRQIRERDKKVKIIFLTMHPEVVYAVQALNAGGSGYVLKSAAAEELVTAIEEALRGRVFITHSIAEPVTQALYTSRRFYRAADGLTQRQIEVLHLLTEGRAPRDIAALLHISHRTVEFHKYRIMETLGLHTVAELAAYAVKRRMVP